MKEYTIAVDLAKKRDFYAVIVFQNVQTIIPGSKLLGSADRTIMEYDIVYIDKAKELRYPEMVERTVRIAGYSKIKNNYDLLVDGTGVGEAVVDYLREAGLYPIPIIFTSGTQVNEIYEDIGKVFGDIGGDRLQSARTLKELRIPKEDLISAGRILLEQGRVHIAKGVKYRDDFEDQMMSFTGKLNEVTKHTKYEAEDEEVHDDLVVCYSMGSWWGLHSHSIDGFKEKILPPRGHSTAWEPADYY